MTALNSELDFVTEVFSRPLTSVFNTNLISSTNKNSVTKFSIVSKLNVNAPILSGKNNDLGSVAVNAKLSFGTGTNCNTPYGCTDVDYTSNPNILVIRPPSIVPVQTVSCQSNVALVFNLETNFEVNYRTINTELKVATVNMTLNNLNIFVNNIAAKVNLNTDQNQLYSSNKNLSPVRTIKSTLLMRCCGNKNFDTIPSTFRREYPQFNSSN